MAGLIQFTNNAATLLASSITSGDTSLTVSAATGSLFPTLAGGQYFYCTLTNAAATVIEIVKVTARSTDTFTIVRAQDGTAASAFSAGEKVELRLVAVELQNFPQLDSTNTFAAAQTFSAGITSTVTPVGVTSGGTGLGTLSANNVILGAGTSTPTFVAPSTSGNLLTSNGTTWVSSTPATPNVAGGASTVSQGTSLTLTSASNRVQNVTFTAASLSITLPDATTLSAGGPTFIITNSGFNSFSIKLNSGIVLTNLLSGQSVMCEVYDISTAAGLWLISNSDIASSSPVGSFPTSVIDSTNAAFPYFVDDAAGNSQNGSFVDCLKLTSTTALLVWARSGNKSIYGVVATNTAGVLSYGTIVQIYDGSAGGAAAIQSATAMLLTGLTTGMVFLGRNATAAAVPFSISGSTITVGTISANFGICSNRVSIVHSVVAMSATEAMIVYNNATFTQILVATMTYNGASAPTLGTPTAGINIWGYAAESPYGVLVKLTSTTLQLWYLSAINTFATRVVTSNGASAPTLGTAITATVVSATGVFADTHWDAYAYSATETSIVFVPDYTSSPFVASYTISGTTVTQTVAPTAMVNPNSFGLPARIEWVTSTTGLFFRAYVVNNRSRYVSLSKIYKLQYTPSGGTILYSGVGTIPDSSAYSYLAGMCLLSSTTGIVAGYAAATGYISANVFSVL